MRRAILRTVDAAQTLLAIRRLPMEREAMKRIQETWLKVFLMNRYDARARRAEIAGFEVEFLDFPALFHLFQEIFVRGEYLFASAEPAPLIFDCGSNIGVSILFFKLIHPGARIVGFEPGEEAFNCLERNIRRNGLDGVTLHRLALAAEDGTIDFYHDRERPGSLRQSTVRARMPRHRRTVEASTLSRHLEEEVDFLKMDIEGAEIAVLEELRESGRLRRVRRMAIEYHHHIDPHDDALSRLLGVLEECGFGYQIHAHLERPLEGGRFQDVLVYAYRRP